MKSVIHESDLVQNAGRRFGSATAYHPARYVRTDGTDAGLLFTAAEIDVAARRAEANPEDVPTASNAWPLLLVALALAVAPAVFALMLITAR